MNGIMPVLLVLSLIIETNNAMKKLLLFYFINFLSISLYSQFNFEGAIIDEGKEVIPFSVVRLENEVSSFKETTHIDGTFKFSNIPKASYTCIISYLGYFSDTIYNFNIEKHLKDTFQLFPNPEPLEAVIVGWRRHPIEKITTRQDSLKYKIKIWGFVKYFAKNTKNIDTDLVSLLHNKLSIEDFINKYYFVQKKPKKSNKVDTDLCLVKHYWISNFGFLDKNMQNKLWQMSKNRINNLNYEFKHHSSKEKHSKLSYSDLEKINYNNSIIGIARLWNYINYYYPHICQLKNWENVLEESLVFVNNFVDYRDYLNALKYIANETKDDHSSFNFNKNSQIKKYPNTLPVNYKSIENKLVITKIFKENFALKINDTILKINNKTLIENKDFFVSKELKLETSPIRLSSDSNIVSIKRNNKILNIVLTKEDLMSGKKLFFLNWYKKDSMNFEAYNTLYVDGNQGTKSEYKYLKKNIENYESFVLDLRGYPNNTKYFSSLFLKNGPVTYALVRPVRNNPGKFKLQQIKQKKGKVKDQKIYVLVNQYTNSASETECIELMNNPNVKFVGSYTSSSIGGKFQKLILPGSFSFTTSTIGIVTSKKKNLHPNGIPINYLVEDENDLEKEIIKILKK